LTTIPPSLFAIFLEGVVLVFVHLPLPNLLEGFPDFSVREFPLMDHLFKVG
jgi:hypothetical protein